MIHFDVHGVTVGLSTDHPPLAEALSRDLAGFLSTNGTLDPDVLLHASLAPPPRPPAGLRWPALRRGHVIDRPGERWVVYQGRAGSEGRATLRAVPGVERAWLWSLDADLLWEASWLYLMSRVGELLDRRGVHRLHALGLTRGGRGALLMLPSGGGKSTLGLAALRERDFGLLSDDLPLLDPQGDLLPFPGRLGFTHPPEGVAPEHIRPFRRIEHGLKWLVDLDAFPGRASGPASPQLLLVGARDPTARASLVQVPPRAAWPTLLSAVVVGVGLPQAIEHFLRPDPADVPAKLRIVRSRLRACQRLLRQVEVWRVTLGGDQHENIDQVLGLLDRRLG
jgi:hypothetical protein